MLNWPYYTTDGRKREVRTCQQNQRFHAASPDVRNWWRQERNTAIVEGVPVVKIKAVYNITPSVKDNLGRVQYPTWINESGLCSLIMLSKLPNAQKYQRWVISEVIPSVQKTRECPATTVKEHSMADKLLVIESAVRVLNMTVAEKHKMLVKFCELEGLGTSFLPT